MKFSEVPATAPPPDEIRPSYVTVDRPDHFCVATPLPRTKPGTSRRNKQRSRGRNKRRSARRMPGPYACYYALTSSLHFMAPLPLDGGWAGGDAVAAAAGSPPRVRVSTMASSWAGRVGGHIPRHICSKVLRRRRAYGGSAGRPSPWVSGGRGPARSAA